MTSTATLRTLATHLSALVQIVGQEGYGAPLPAHLSAVKDGRLFLDNHDEALAHWNRFRLWLAMGAGVVEVVVQPRDPSEPSNWMCSPAAQYTAEVNRQVSRITTAYTRHLYVWNAIEQYLKYWQLQPVKYKGNKKGEWVTATNFLKDRRFAERLPHGYRYVRDRLRHYAFEHGDQVADSGVRAAFEDNQWQDAAGTLLAVGNKLRHPMAHGSAQFLLDSAEFFPDDEDREKGADQIIDALSLSTRGLLFSLQMMLSTQNIDQFQVLEDIQPEEGWPIWNASLGWQLKDNPTSEEFFYSIHLAALDLIP